MLKLLCAGLVVVATAAIAQAPGDAPVLEGPNNDPDQVVCIKEKETGSRLSTRRVCRTRAQWEAHQAQSRQVIEKVQNYRPSQGQ